jgi:HEAT repeat protein
MRRKIFRTVLVAFLVSEGIFMAGAVFHFTSRNLMLRRVVQPSSQEVKEWLEGLASSDEKVVKTLDDIAGIKYGGPFAPQISAIDAGLLADKIFPLLNNPNEEIRAEAVFALAALCVVNENLLDKTMEEFRRLLKEDKDTGVKLSVMQNIYELSSRLSHQDRVDIALQLVESLNDQDEMVAAKAADVIGAIVVNQLETQGREKVISAVIQAQREGKVNSSDYVQLVIGGIFSGLLKSSALQSEIDRLKYGPPFGEFDEFALAFFKEQDPTVRLAALVELFDIIEGRNYSIRVREEALFYVSHLLYRGIQSKRSDLISRSGVEYLFSKAESLLNPDHVAQILGDVESPVREREYFSHQGADILKFLPFYLGQGDEELIMQLAGKFIEMLDSYDDTIRESAIVGLRRILVREGARGGVIRFPSYAQENSILSREKGEEVIAQIRRVMENPDNKLSSDDYRSLNGIIQLWNQIWAS